jgi:hypothetical protein
MKKYHHEIQNRKWQQRGKREGKNVSNIIGGLDEDLSAASVIQ